MPTPALRYGVAPQLMAVLASRFQGNLPIRLHAWDGSTAGPPEAPQVILNRREALRHLVYRPDELGLARAYISGALDVQGNLTAALRGVWDHVAHHGTRLPHPGELARAGWLALVLQLVGSPPRLPRGEARLRGLRHTRSRDAAAIAHHYNHGNELYQRLLDDSMAYSCGYWTSAHADLATAQHAKLDLVCRKLNLGPGTRLLDVGCGWGALAVHAAEHYGAQVTAVTLAADQAQYVDKRVAERDLGDRVEVRLADYRDISDGDFEAVAVIEMGEHVGRREYPAFADQLYRLVRPGGRVLLQQMSRRGSQPGGGPFISTYIAPDMHMRPVGQTLDILATAGLEIRDVQALREHYVHTARAWADKLDCRRAQLRAEFGEQTVRIWELYLAGGALAFEQGRMGLDQILATRPGGKLGELQATTRDLSEVRV